MRITAIAITVFLSATLAAQAPPARIPAGTFDPARAAIIDRALQRYIDADRVAAYNVDLRALSVYVQPQ